MPRRRPPARLDVYLLPAVVGGGLGDIDEVLCAGRYLADAGFPLTLYRARGRPFPRSVDGPWSWPPHTRTDRLVRRAPKALTIAPAWGISAAPSRDEPYGRGGPWEEEAGKIERAYGPDATIHLSLEEFARTLTSRREVRERWREGGIPSREIRRRARRRSFAREAARFHALYRRFRAFDRANVVHLYATFRPDRAFALEFPEAIQSGPLWPIRPTGPAPATNRRARWVWYASPASAERIAERVLRTLARSDPPPFLCIRSPRPWPRSIDPRLGALELELRSPSAWRSEFDRAQLRVVTGSRTLLEAIVQGGPFLYFNGILGAGSATRRHRPEKIDGLREVARLSRPARRDLSDFARGRRVEAVVERALRDPPRLPARFREHVRGQFAPEWGDAGALVVRIARAWERTPQPSGIFVRDLRGAAHRSVMRTQAT